MCGISGEMLKAGGEIRSSRMVAYNYEQSMHGRVHGMLMMASSRKTLVIAVDKKGSKLQCKNCRGISLLSISGKV